MAARHHKGFMVGQLKRYAAKDRQNTRLCLPTKIYAAAPETGFCARHLSDF